MAIKIISAIGLVLTAILSAVALFTPDSVILSKIALTWDTLAPTAVAILQIWGIAPEIKAAFKKELSV